MRFMSALFAALILPVSSLMATVTVNVRETGSGNQTVNVTPGGTLNVDVLVAESGEGTGISGVQLSLNATGPASGKIAVAGPADGGGTSAAINSAEWDANLSASATGLPLVTGALPQASYGTGYIANGGKLSGAVTPSSRLATYQVSVAADAVPGDYLVTATGLAFPDFVASTADINVASGSALTIHVGSTCTASFVTGLFFYNNSSFGGTPAPDKVGLVSGPATFTNISSYSRGLNGIYLDVSGLCGTPTAADFEFRTGNTTTPAAWGAAPPPSSITVLPGAGTGGSDRIKLVWPDYVAGSSNMVQTRNWLQIRLKATSNTGLAADQVVYFGLLMGSTGIAAGHNASAYAVVSGDYNGCYNGRVNTFPGTQPMTNVNDFTRDKNVTSADYNLAYNERGSLFTAAKLVIISP